MTITEVTPHPTDAERFGHILAVQRAAHQSALIASSMALRLAISATEPAQIAAPRRR